jgi:hypothetical protein
MHIGRGISKNYTFTNAEKVCLTASTAPVTVKFFVSIFYNQIDTGGGKDDSHPTARHSSFQLPSTSVVIYVGELLLVVE